jgi:hypothetical protein
VWQFLCAILDMRGSIMHRSRGVWDRHGMVVDPVNRMLYEFFTARKAAMA